MPALREIPQQLLTQWRGLSRGARAGISLATAAVLCGLGYLILASGRIEYAPLYSGLSSEDGGAVVDKLHEMRIPVRVSHGGEVIEVQREKIPEVRLQLATQGLPRGSAVGYELFDKQGLGVSDFTQRVNYHRALQGELERSISTLAAVKRARVHLVVPERNLFRTAEQQASASVVLTLNQGHALSQQQVQGIVHLVASSVEGLAPQKVTVLDQRGEVLSQLAGREANAAAALAYQREVELSATRKAQEMLDRALGPGHSLVRVSALIDTTQVERTQEEWNPDQQVVRSEQDVDDVVGASQEGSEGVAGARANLPGGPPPQVNGSGGSRRHSQTKNYEIGKTVRKESQPIGKLERLTVAVLVDGSYSGEGAERKFMKRTKEELDAYAAIVKEAVGLDEKRGDALEIRCVEFAQGEKEAEVMSATPAIPPWAYAAGAALLVLVGAMGLGLLRRRQLTQTVLPGGVTLPSSVQQLEASLSDSGRTLPGALAEGPTPQGARMQALEMLTSHPERAARVLRAWLNEPKEMEEGASRGEPQRT